ncbi:hypothetical protein [Burkholderia cenocepacia]|uniref:hypothetical protein n=1 Tax=Burkholderia cenocepacia TaxID=95486 RepID=UPI001CF5DD02|nr:hypothetical protein [Burkholderia cenocepacia]MCA8237697.1 hypothetical protein [Burkholderia cenocepacia]
MSEPILSREELQHAVRAVLIAVLGGPHDIERASVTVHFDENKPGHNALNQMSSRIESELASLLEKLRGEPVGKAGNMPGTDGFTMAAFRADDVPVGTNLYTLKGQS